MGYNSDVSVKIIVLFILLYCIMYLAALVHEIDSHIILFCFYLISRRQTAGRSSMAMI